MKVISTILSALGYLGMFVSFILLMMTSWELIIQPAQAGETVGFPDDLTQFIFAFFVFAGGILTFATGRALSAISENRPRVRIIRRDDGFYLVSKDSELGPFVADEVAQAALEKPVLADTFKQLR